MRTSQGNMLLSLRAVEAFLDENAASLTGVIYTGTRQKLKDAIAELSGHASDQTGNALAAQGATRTQEAARRMLMRDHMAPITRIAKAELPDTPEVEPLRMPRGRPTAPRLAAAADGMAKAAAKHASVFIDAGLPTDFISQLNSAVEAMLAAISDRSQSRGKRKSATTGIKARLTAGRKTVHVLDAFVQTALKDNPILLSGWNGVKRVQQTAGRPQTPVSTPTTTPTTTPAPNSTLFPTAA